ncbi:MAG TPA: hypothetical protein VGJ97_08040 [Anaerolineaceae bacterium]
MRSMSSLPQPATHQAVIFITHNVGRVYRVADSYTVIRQGRNVGAYRKGELIQGDIANLITGDRDP